MHSQEAADHDPVLVKLLSLSHLLQLLEHLVPLTLMIDNSFVYLIQALHQAASYFDILFSKFIQSDSPVVIIVNHTEYFLNDAGIEIYS